MNAILLAIAAAIFWGFGNVFQKQGMTTSFPKISLSNLMRQIPTIVKTLATNWLWMIGLVLMLTGAGLYFVALGIGDITVVQPILCLVVVVSAVVGVVWLKEKVSRIEWIGIALVLLGVVAVSIAGGGKTGNLPTGSAQLVFFIVVIVLTGLTFLLRKVGASLEFSLAVAAGLVFGLANISAKLLTDRMMVEAGAPAAGESFNYFRAVVLQAIFTDYPIYLVIVTNVAGNAFYQTAFANGRASIVAAIVTIMGNTVPIIAAITIFGEQVKLLHAVGIAVVLVGAAVLALGSRNKSSGDSNGTVSVSS